MIFLRCYSGLPALHPSLSFGAALCAFKTFLSQTRNNTRIIRVYLRSSVDLSILYLYLSEAVQRQADHYVL
jgi:hypothetical protein